MAELTISEAAVALGVSVDTIRRKIKRGELRARQDNKGRYMVAVEAPGAMEIAPKVAATAVGAGRARSRRREAERDDERDAEDLHEDAATGVSIPVAMQSGKRQKDTAVSTCRHRGSA